MKVYTAHVITESLDHYIWVFNNNPTREFVIMFLAEYEGSLEEFDWYYETTSVTIQQTEVYKVPLQIS